jgi:ketopantoate reductase
VSVSVKAHGARTDDIAANGLIARDVSDGHRTEAGVEVVADVRTAIYDLVLVAVTRDRCADACVELRGLAGSPSILMMGNNPGRAAAPEAMQPSVRLGFPGVGGVLAGGIAEYTRIKPQPTALESSEDQHVADLASRLIARGFAVQRIVDMEGWLQYHEVLVACICRALGRCDNDASRLADDRSTLRLMCAAITEGFASLRQHHVRGLPANLRILHGRLLSPVAVTYWSRTMRSPNGELWFGAHARHASGETTALSRDVLARLSTHEAATHLRELLREE